MPQVEIYTMAWCGYCQRAKALLARKGVAYDEYDIDTKKGLRAEMIERSGGRSSAPQIFIDGKGIGGCDDLYALDSAGQLDPLLAS